jgi:hypothetical protein
LFKKLLTIYVNIVVEWLEWIVDIKLLTIMWGVVRMGVVDKKSPFFLILSKCHVCVKMGIIPPTII